jgi:hypothetical protein
MSARIGSALPHHLRAKRRGVKLGGDRRVKITAKGRKLATIKELRASGAESLRAIAADLDSRGIPTGAATANGRPCRWRE